MSAIEITRQDLSISQLRADAAGGSCRAMKFGHQNLIVVWIPNTAASGMRLADGLTGLSAPPPG